jgi:hypothetical protein
VPENKLRIWSKEEQEDYLSKVLFPDAATFHTSGTVTKHDCQIWDFCLNNKYLEHERDAHEVNMWYVVTSTEGIGQSTTSLKRQYTVMCIWTCQKIMLFHSFKEGSTSPFSKSVQPQILVILCRNHWISSFCRSGYIAEVKFLTSPFTHLSALDLFAWVDVKEKRKSSKRCRYRSEKKEYGYCYSIHCSAEQQMNYVMDIHWATWNSC